MSSYYLYFKIDLWGSSVLLESSLITLVTIQIFIEPFFLSNIALYAAGGAEIARVHSWPSENLQLEIEGMSA